MSAAPPLPALAALLDDAGAFAAKHLGEADRAPLTDLVLRCRRRSGFLGRPLVAALIGGTGTGKSTLLNALARRRISPPGRVRPCTRKKVVWAHASSVEDVRSLVAIRAADEIVAHEDERARDLIIIDLPDYDSVAPEHRAEVDRVIPSIDLAIWVVDPDKYSDRVLHRDYLARLASYRDLFVFAFNRIDTIALERPDAPADDPSVRRVVRHFQDEIGAVGLAGVPVFAISALASLPDGPLGPAAGEMEAFEAHIFRAVERKRARTRKILLDLRAGLAGAAHALSAEGPDAALACERAGAALAREWPVVRSEVTPDLIDPIFSPDLPRTLAADLRRGFRASVGGPVGLVVGLGAGSPRDTSPSGTRSALAAWRGRARVNRVSNRVSRMVDEVLRAAAPSPRLVREIEACRPDAEACGRVVEQASRDVADAIAEAAGGPGGRRRSTVFAVGQLALPAGILLFCLYHVVRRFDEILMGGSLWGVLALLLVATLGPLVAAGLILRIVLAVRAARRIEAGARAFEERVRDGLETQVMRPVARAISAYEAAARSLADLTLRTEAEIAKVGEPEAVGTAGR